MRVLLGLIIGLFIAWNIKQPPLMKELQDWGVTQFDDNVDELCKRYRNQNDNLKQ